MINLFTKIYLTCDLVLIVAALPLAFFSPIWVVMFLTGIGMTLLGIVSHILISIWSDF